MGYNISNYGTTLTGAPTHESPYQYIFGVDRNIIACMKSLSHGEREQFSFFIQHDYRYTLYLDDLPSATILRDNNNKELPVDYLEGIPIGRYEQENGYPQIVVYNHLDIKVIIHHTVEDA